jgi:hypothetical protein
MPAAKSIHSAALAPDARRRGTSDRCAPQRRPRSRGHRRALGVASPALAVLAGLCALLATLAGLCGSASAFVTHPLLSSFGSFAQVQSIAVDQATGDVYVLDVGAGGGSLYKFTASGQPAKFTALAGEPTVIEGVGGSSGESQLAVDSSASGPAKGDIYVANGGEVAIYAADGKRLGALTSEPPAPWGEPCGIAVDPAGNVYVGLFGNVNKYVPSANPVTNADFSSSMAGLGGICNIAADAQGNVFVDGWPSGPIQKYGALEFGSPAATALGTVDKAGSTLAVDPASNDVYVDEGGQVSQFGPHGEPFETPQHTFGAAGPGAISNSLGIAASDAAGANGDVYVADGQGHVNVFGPLATVPDVVTGAATDRSTTGATLTGTVDPDAISVTGCKFEYGTDTSYGQSVSCATSPGAGNAPVEVTAPISGLEAGTIYHYRLVASNANGTNLGHDSELLTLHVPLVERTWSTEVGISTGTLNAEVNPVGSETTYHFEYGTTAAYGTTVPVPDAALPPEDAELEVSQSLTSLRPETTYHYRVVAVNSSGTTTGPDRVFTTATAPSEGQAEVCPNSAFRAGNLSANLPDCRAYEMVSPLDKNGGDIDGSSTVVVSSADGDRLVYNSLTGFGESDGSGVVGISTHLAVRGSASWESHGITPTPAPNSDQIFIGDTDFQGFSEDLESGLVEGYALPGASGGAPNGQNLYAEDLNNEELQTVSKKFTEETLSQFELSFTPRAYSADMGVVIFETPANLLPEATGGNEKLYAWENGVLKLAGLLPGNVIPVGGAQSPEGTFQGPQRNDTISRDGSRIIFMATPEGGSSRQLYMRKSGTSTVWVSQSEGSTPVAEPSEVGFETMTPDGHQVFFTTSSRLLDSDPGGPGLGLYRYTDGPNPEAESNLTFIARINPSQDGPQVKGVSTDGSHVYFFSGANETLPKEGLYLWDDGTIHFVGPGDAEGTGSIVRFTQVSANGEYFAFLDSRQITAEDTGLTPQGAHYQAMYVYSEASEKLTCASCPPSGAAMTANAEVVPSATGSVAEVNMPIRQNFLSSNGKYVFFSTAQALLPQDTNRLNDVYEYDTETGKLSLLSSGSGEKGAWFANASPSGQDVFIATAQRLTASDTDTLVDLYDARIDGGLAEPPPPPVPCDGDACQGVPSAAPTFNTSSGFEGLGNRPASTSSEPSHARPKSKPKSKSVTRAKRLSKALATCRKQPRKRRPKCEVRARKKFDHKQTKHPKRRAGR